MPKTPDGKKMYERGLYLETGLKTPRGTLKFQPKRMNKERMKFTCCKQERRMIFMKMTK